MDLYDSCVLIFSLSTSLNSNTLDKILAIPAIRVLAGRSVVSSSDVETAQTPHFVPRGATNFGVGLTWMYWIPYADSSWLQFGVDCDTNMKVVGKHQAQHLNDAQITVQLTKEELNVSLSHVEDIKQILNLSRDAMDELCRLLL